MTYYAKIKDSIVVQVIVADELFLKDGSEWVKTLYASVGYIYDKKNGSFRPEKPYKSWVFNSDTNHYSAPKPYPLDGLDYVWVESAQLWATNS